MPKDVIILGYSGPFLPDHANNGPCGVCKEPVFAVPMVTMTTLEGKPWKEREFSNIKAYHQSCFRR